MPLFENLRIERSHGPTVLSRKPVVRVTGELADARAFAAAWPGLLARLEKVLGELCHLDFPGGVRQDADLSALAQLPRTPTAEQALDEAGRLLAASVAVLMTAARAPELVWGALVPTPPRFLAYWDDWMEGTGSAAAQGAVRMLEAAAEPEGPLREAAKDALTQVRDLRVDGFVYPLVRAAEARGIPWRTLSRGDLITVYGQGRRQRWIRATLGDDASFAGVNLSMRKDQTNRLLAQAGFPVPKQRVALSREAAARAAGEVGFPVVVKPLAGSLGKATSLWIESPDAAAAAYDLCGAEGTPVLVEEQLWGEAYRVTVLNGAAVAVARHLMPFVTGDGRSTVKELISEWNRCTAREVPDDYAGSYPIDLDYHAAAMARRLKAQAIGLDDVPEQGREVFLAYLPERIYGGLAVDRTDQAHPKILRMAEAVAKVAGLRTLGLDLITTDIAQPPGRVPLGINEINSCPHPRIHEMADRRREIGSLALTSYFPEDDQGRIPLALFYEFAEPAVLDILEALLLVAGWTPGVAGPDTARIGGYALRPYAGRAHPGLAVLRDRRADAGVFAVGQKDLQRRGLPSDHADIVAFPPGSLSRAAALRQQMLACLAALPGQLLLSAPGEMPEWLRKAAAQRRWVAVAAPEDGMQPPPAGAEILCCETGPRGELRALLCGEGSRDLLCDRLDEDRAAAQLWALAALLGFGFAPGKIRGLALRCRPADPGSEPAGTVSGGVFQIQDAGRA